MATINDSLDASTQLPMTESSSKEQITIQNQGFEAVKDLVYGSTAGILGKFVEYPFDTVKVRLQSQNVTQPGQRLQSPLDAFRAAFRAPEGPLRSLYRGISAPLVGAAVETSSLFFSYRVAKDIWIANNASLRAQKASNPNKDVELPFSALLMCGAASGAFTSLLLTPIELVKCKMQVPIPPSHIAQPILHPAISAAPTIPQIIRNIFRTQGVLGFWHGQLGTLIRETGGSAAWFGSYEGVKILFRRYDPSIRKVEDVKVYQQMLAGAAAGMMYNFVFYPADTIKSRMQTEDAGTGTNSRRSNFTSTGRELWRQSGLKGFYRGCGITVSRAAPSSAIIFSIYEALRKYLG